MSKNINIQTASKNIKCFNSESHTILKISNIKYGIKEFHKVSQLGFKAHMVVLRGFV